MKKIPLTDLLRENSYPGRGIVIGRSENGEHAIVIYFIMGRSENSRNRIFKADGEGIRTQAFDPAKLTDPSLVIYAPVRVWDRLTIVTNGDQTDTIYDFLEDGQSFEAALRTRAFEPDAPNYTPRISGLVDGLTTRLSILKSAEGDPQDCHRFFFEYENTRLGEGRFLHTYQGDGNPIPSFEGEPELVAIPGDIDSLAQSIWGALNEENKVSLFVRYINILSGEFESRILNKNN